MPHIIHISHIMWDIDEPFLPRELDIAAEDMLEPGESIEDVGYVEIVDRIAEFISEKYGFDVQGFCTDDADAKNKKEGS